MQKIINLKNILKFLVLKYKIIRIRSIRIRIRIIINSIVYY